MNLKPRYERVYTKPAGAPCNICQIAKPLTEDHVPPRSCLEDLHLEMEPFEHRLRADAPRLPWSQSGVRFKTLCADCNSILGKNFDPALAQLVKDVRSWLRSPMALGDRWTVGARVDLVVKSVFGHLLAATTDDAQTKADRQMRDYLNGNLQRPGTETNVFYWLHEDHLVGVLRGVAMPTVRGRFDEVGIFSIIKVPPLGFIVTDTEQYEELPRLIPHSTTAPPQSQTVRLWRSLRHDPDWPERIDEGNYLVGGASLRDALSARPRKLKR
jgi:hypothetical protein